MFKYTKKYIIYFIFASILITSSIYLVGVFQPKDAGFKKVDALSIKADLLGCFYGRDQISLAFWAISEKDEKFKVGYKYKKSSLKSSPVMDYPKLAVTPDDTKVFMAMNKAIFQFDIYYRLQSKIKLDLGSERKFYMFGPFLEASDETLYFSNFNGGNSIYSCMISDSKNTLEKTKYQFEGEKLARKEISENSFSDLSLFNPEPISVPLFRLEAEREKISSKENEYRVLSPGLSVDFEIIDHVENKGWVFSTNFQHGKDYSTDIYFLKNKEASPKKLNQGSFARLGADGYIYYLKRTGYLCRINPKDNIEEHVFKFPESFTKKLITKVTHYQGVLTKSFMSRDRKVLAHKFNDRIAVFDLIEKEYRIIDKVPPSITDIAFIKIKQSLIDYRKGRSLYQKGDYENAIKYLKKAADKGDALSLVGLGFIYEDGTGVTKDYKEAFKYFTKASELKDKQAQCILGNYYSKGMLGEKDELKALHFYKLSAKQGYPFAQNNLACYYADKNVNLVEAEELTKLAIAQKPKEASYIDTLGWVYYKQKKNDLAIQQFNKALTLDPNVPAFYDHLGDAYYAMGKTKEAAEQWQKALELTKDEELKKKIEEKLKGSE